LRQDVPGSKEAAVRDFTLDELKQYDGKDGRPAYVAYRGIVYDVTESAMWPEGDHEGMHMAGADLTEAHDDAPHDVHIVDFPEVGKLV
jgi:predicted heme/steroid binding protein